MNKEEAIEYLREKVIEIPTLARLRYNNHEYQLWIETIRGVVENVFGRESGEYQKLAVPYQITGSNDEARQNSYKLNLKMRGTSILSIIKTYETLGFEKETLPETKKTVETPLAIFDAMQFHSRIIKVSRERFITGNYEDAIYRAFVEVNNFIKEKTGSDDDGKSLMSNTFNCKNPTIKLNSLITQSDKDEQEGFMHLFMGAMQGIRNPKAHENLSQRDPLRTLEYLALANLLMRRVEESKVKKIKPPRQRWNLERFLADAQERNITPERIATMKKLIDFTIANSDAGILWGTGTTYGSFAFQKLINNKATSIFQIYTDGTFFLYFQPLKNKGITEAVLYRFRLNLNEIPGVNIPESVIAEKDKYGSLSINILSNPSNLDSFQKAVLTLCKDIEFIQGATS